LDHGFKSFEAAEATIAGIASIQFDLTLGFNPESVAKTLSESQISMLKNKQALSLISMFF
jgi:hypothetical protein